MSGADTTINPTSLDLDVAALAAYLQQHITNFNGLKEIEKFSVGQSNPTYLLRDTDGNRYVMRRQ